MKFCVLMGSPRKNGNTAALLRPFLEKCAALGVQTRTIRLYERQVGPCLGCMACQDREELGCVQGDDFADIFREMADSDLIVLATPIYAFFCTAPMKALLDRAIYAGVKNYGAARGVNLLAGRRAASVVTCGYPADRGAGAWEQALKLFCRHGRMDYLGMLCRRDMGRDAPFLSGEYEQAARAFARRLAEEVRP